MQTGRAYGVRGGTRGKRERAGAWTRSGKTKKEEENGGLGQNQQNILGSVNKKKSTGGAWKLQGLTCSNFPWVSRVGFEGTRGSPTPRPPKRPKKKENPPEKILSVETDSVKFCAPLGGEVIIPEEKQREA